MTTTFQQFVQPAQELFRYPKQPYYHTQYEKLDASSTQSTPYLQQSSPHIPHSSTEYSPALPQESKSNPVDSRTTKRFLRLQRIVGIVFGIADVCSTLLTMLIEGVMVYVLVKFYQTRNIPAPNRTGPWSKQTKLWPTYMLAAAALVTFILAVVGLILAFSKKKSKKQAQLTLRVVRTVIHVASWIAVVAFYRWAKTGTDLWGWSCSDKAEQIQQYYVGPLNFDQLCKIQSGSWFLSIAEVSSKIVFAIVGFYLQIKVNGIKRSIIKDLGEIGWEAFQNS